MRKIIVVIEKTRLGLKLGLETEGTGENPDEIAVADAFMQVLRKLLQHFHNRFNRGMPEER